MENAITPRRDWLRLVHRISGFIGLPFLLISILLAVALSHVQWLEVLSPKVHPSLPIPPVALNETVQPGSWDQAAALAAKASGGGKTTFIWQMDNGNIKTVAVPPEMVGRKGNAHEAHSSHSAEPEKRLPWIFWIKPETMTIFRAEDFHNSLVANGHAVHGTRFFGLQWFSIALVTSVSLLVLLITGAMLARRDRKAFAGKSAMARWHIRIGQVLGVLTVVIVITTLQLEHAFWKGDPKASHPIPALTAPQPLQPGSLDQARAVAAQVMGAWPAGMYDQDSHGLKFTQAGDGIGGLSVWVDGQTMQVKRITDWRNDPMALNFILHDGRWLGGMNAFNINDAAALGLLFLTLSGVVLWWRGRRAGKREAGA